MPFTGLPYASTTVAVHSSAVPATTLAVAGTTLKLPAGSFASTVILVLTAAKPDVAAVIVCMTPAFLATVTLAVARPLLSVTALDGDTEPLLSMVKLIGLPSTGVPRLS